MKYLALLLFAALAACNTTSTPIYLPGVTLSGYGASVTVPPSVIPPSAKPTTVAVPVTVPASTVPTSVSVSVSAAPSK
jgi:hypothetical protein